MQDTLLVAKFYAAQFIVNIGEWFIERGIEVAGEGSIDVQFEANLAKPLPWWLPLPIVVILSPAVLFVMAMLGGN